MDSTETMDMLEEIGKTSLTVAFDMGQFYFPKVVWEYVGGETQIGMYETDFKLFETLCDEAASQGPLEYMAHTADSYWLNVEVDPELAALLKAGKTSATEQFELDNPLAFEALSITMTDKDGGEYARTLPYRRQGRTLRWLDRIRGESDQTGGRYIDAMAAAIKSSYAAANENA